MFNYSGINKIVSVKDSFVTGANLKLMDVAGRIP